MLHFYRELLILIKVSILKDIVLGLYRKYLYVVLMLILECVLVYIFGGFDLNLLCDSTEDNIKEFKKDLTFEYNRLEEARREYDYWNNEYVDMNWNRYTPIHHKQLMSSTVSLIARDIKNIVTEINYIENEIVKLDNRFKPRTFVFNKYR